MRKLMTALVLTTMPAVVAAASAALPHPGARYTGPTNSKVVNGFGNTVTFLAGAAPRGALEGPSPVLAQEKSDFGSTRVQRWFGRTWP